MFSAYHQEQSKNFPYCLQKKCYCKWGQMAKHYLTNNYCSFCTTKCCMLIHSMTSTCIDWKVSKEFSPFLLQFYRPKQSNWEFWLDIPQSGNLAIFLSLWFYVKSILADFWRSKTTISTILEALNFDFLKNFTLEDI